MPWLSATTCTSTWRAVGEPSFEEHARVTEPGGCLCPRACERVFQRVLVPRRAHAERAVSRRRLHQHWVAEPRRVRACAIERVDDFAAPRHDVDTGALGELLGGNFVGQARERVRRRADHRDPEHVAPARERGVLGESPPSEPDRVDAVLAQRAYERVDVESVGAVRAAAGDGGLPRERVRRHAHGLVGFAHEQ